MIVIERTWKEPDPRGGDKLNKVARECYVRKTKPDSFADLIELERNLKGE